MNRPRLYDLNATLRISAAKFVTGNYHPPFFWAVDIAHQSQINVCACVYVCVMWKGLKNFYEVTKPVCLSNRLSVTVIFFHFYLINFSNIFDVTNILNR